MTPKEKAKELVEFRQIRHVRLIQGLIIEAKQCALIAVDEILNECIDVKERYWQDVKLQLEKL
jgi:hypothetical protein